MYNTYMVFGKNRKTRKIFPENEKNCDRKNTEVTLIWHPRKTGSPGRGRRRPLKFRFISFWKVMGDHFMPIKTKFSLPFHTPKTTMTISILSTFLLLALIFHPTDAAVFNIQNKCPYTIWAGAVPGGGQQLNPGQTWPLTVTAGTQGARIWPRTGCNFDGSGRGGCQTGDCNGLLQCQNYGTPPNTLAEFGLNQFNNLDFFDISLVDGFNVPMAFNPTSNGCTRGISCTADINGQCPGELRATGGCNNPCTVHKTDNYCCNSGSCGPTPLSRFFKERCPDAYSYPKDDPSSTFTCPGGTNYDVIFCP